MPHVVVNDIGEYTREEVDAQLRANGREVRFRYELLDKDANPLGFISSVQPGGTITYAWLAEIKREASFRMLEDEDFQQIDFLSNMLKPYMHLRMPDGLWASFPLGVLVLESQGRTSESGHVIHQVQAYDRGIHLREEVSKRRHTAAKDSNIIDEVRSHLDARNLPNDLPDDDATLTADRSWDGGTSIAVIVNELLDAANYASLYFDENGIARSNPYILPGNREPEITYETDEWSVIQEQATETLDLFNVPNKWVLSVSQPDREDLVAVFRNNDPDSPTSIPSRGRTITRYETMGDEDAPNLARLHARVRRLAHEDSSVYGHIEFTTNLNPRHGENNIIHLRHDPLGIDAQYSETDWQMTLQAGATMSHTARIKVDLREDFTQFVTGEAEVEAPTTDKRGMKAVTFDADLQSPFQVITQARTNHPGTTDSGSVRGFGANHSNPEGTNLHLVHFAGNVSSRTLMYVAVGDPPDDSNLAIGTTTAAPTPNAVTTVPITFGKTLTGTVRVFFDIAGGAVTHYRRIGVDSVTATGANLNFFRDSSKRTRLRWFAIGDDGGFDNVAVGNEDLTVSSPPGKASATVTFGKTLQEPVRLFSIGRTSALTQGHTASSDITTTGGTIRAWRDTGTTTTHDWIAIGSVGEGGTEDTDEETE